MPDTNLFIKALTSPDRQYGEVPFYWWNGSELSRERLTEQLEMLAEKGLAGVQINYCHLNGGGEDNLPHGGHGRSLEGTPPQFSEEWWDYFAHAARECERLGMSIGMGDYTIAWIGNGYFTDKVAATQGMSAKNITCERTMLFSGDEDSVSEDTLAVIRYEDTDYRKPVIIYEKGKGVLSKIPGISEVYTIKIHTVNNSIDPLNPDCGRLLRDIYFGEFERRLPDLKPGTLNYFFQDELMFGTDTKYLWNDSLRDKIEEKYGYDILGFLPHLFFNLGSLTAKIRLNLSDVRTALIEENYFKPIFEYHNSRGLIYGCDQSGRGTQPDEFSDYFRTVRWFTAPGNDTPGRAADLIKVKVNSSVAHLYKRPRVWLEGYHSSGWGTTLESITAPTSDNFIFGANLLNLHGLYYSTNGGFFEWAPPDFHFRMPYWDDEKNWLEKYKRLAQILTTGRHSCDIALFYPVSSCDFGENSDSCVKTTFDCAKYLFSRGADFDFIDFQSIENARCENGCLTAADEEYKVLIFAGLDCIRSSILPKLTEFINCGGCVIFLGITPYLSDLDGSDKSIAEYISSMLEKPLCTLSATPAAALTFIDSAVKRSFIPDLLSSERTYVHSRINGDDTLFFVRYAKKGSTCKFRAGGNAYLLDTDTGDFTKITGATFSNGYTHIKMPLDENRDTLILFSEDELDYENETEVSDSQIFIPKSEIVLDGDWNFSLVPTLDNKYGDYYLPAGGIIGAEARFFDIAAVEDDSTVPEVFERTAVPYCTSEAIKFIPTDENDTALSDYVSKNPHVLNAEKFFIGEKEYTVRTPRIHDRYGYMAYDYRGSLFEQGHHGLKGRVYDDNIIFSESGAFFTYVYSDGDCTARLSTGDIKPVSCAVNLIPVTDGTVALRKGKNLLSAYYSYDKDAAPNYRNSAEIKRTSLYVTKENPEASPYPLSISSFASKDYFALSDNSESKEIFCFTFRSVPSLTGLTVYCFGELLRALNGKEEIKIQKTGTGNFGENEYTLTVENVSPFISDVSLFIRSTDGLEYASLIPAPVKLQCEKGKMPAGDLSKTGALAAYSGKAVYEKTVFIEKLDPYERFFLDIGDASATAKAEINGKTAAVMTYRPFFTDITKYVSHGENHIKITVSNTLCNHYSTVPSKYSNFPEDAASGLIGPVSIKILQKTAE